MAKEIERKFLVVNNSYRQLSYRRINIMQGYLSTNKKAVVRIRIADDDAFLTIKGENSGSVRDEWEYSIPVAEAKEMLEKLASKSIISKTRYLVNYEGFKWEVDEFDRPRKGLTVAEIELPSADTEFMRPSFIGDEVTGDPAYYNSNICSSHEPEQ